MPSRLSQLITAGLAPIRQLRKVRALSQEFPETELAGDGREVVPPGAFDSAIVSMNDGTSAALYRRDPAHFRDLLRKTLEIHERLPPEWADARRRVPRRAGRDHLARGLGRDVPALDRATG